MKFCRWTLFEAGRALIYLSRIEQYIRGNQAGFDSNSRTLTHFIAFKEHIADKGLQNRREGSCSRCCTACNSWHFMRRTILIQQQNISDFNKQRNISFQNDISPKP